MLAVVGLLGFMEYQSLSYASGVALWGMLLATTVLTAMWLEGWEPQQVVRWELLRLLGWSALLIAGWQLGVGPVAWIAAALYLVVNLGWLMLLAQGRGHAGSVAARG